MFVTSWFVSIEGRLCYGDRYGNLMYFQNRAEDNGITDDNLYKDTYYDINGEIVSTPIYAEWCTPFSDLGTIVNRKTVKRTNLVTFPNDRTSININVDYIYPFSDTVMPASELTNFSFWTIDFDNFPFDSPSPEVLVVKRKAKKVKLIAFRIWSDTNKRCTLLKFVCTYTIGSKIKN